ncbi:MAG: methionine biosynthesis protein MetW [Patescibacteria group bacterium]
MLYTLKKWLKELFIYPALKDNDPDYTLYWKERKSASQKPLNSFQKKRADFVVKAIESGSSVIDVGCGDGGILFYINQRKKLGRMIGVDFSKEVLALAKEKGIEILNLDISKVEELNRLPQADYVFLFEVIEHLSNSEEILKWAFKNSKKGVFFSVPNTGFFVHRFRLLFGRFPLQWRVRPSEHLRFWTVRDMAWWLKNQSYKNFKIHLYEGMPILNRLWPSLFGQGIFVEISVDK